VAVAHYTERLAEPSGTATTSKPDAMTDSERDRAPPPAASVAGAAVGAHPEAVHGESVVLRALALAWTPRHRKWVIDLLRRLDLRTSRGGFYGQAEVDECLAALAGRGLVARSEQGWQCAPETRIAMFRAALAEPEFRRWREAVLHADGMSIERGWFHFTGAAPAITAARLVFYGGEAVERWHQIEQAGRQLPEWPAVIDQIALSGFDADSFRRADPSLAASMLAVAIDYGLRVLHPALSAVLAHALERLAGPPARGSDGLRVRAAAALVLAGRGEQARALLEGRDDGQARGLRAAILATEGHWEQAASAFEDALATRRNETGQRKRLLDDTYAWLYPMCLFAGRDPARVAAARRHCAGEAGPRKAADDSIWGRWVRAADIRLGDEPADPAFGELHAWFGTRPQLTWAQRLMLRAWLLGTEPPVAPVEHPAGAGRDPALARAAARAALGRALEQTGLAWLAGQVRSAEQVLAGLPPGEPFFVAGAGEAWRDALAAIAALGSDQADAAAPQVVARVLWAIHRDAGGRVTAIEPLEQKRGVRDWNKPRAMPLSRLARNPDLPADDARVARAVRSTRGYAATLAIDIGAAAAALIGHPRVVMAESPERFVQLIEDQPELRFEQVDGHWLLRFEPDLIVLGTQGPGFEFDAHGAVRGGGAPLEGAVFVLPGDGEGQARLIRVSAAHRRVAALAAGGLKVPQTASQELQAAMPALSAHFRLRAEQAPGARSVTASAGLRAELAPAGAGVRLRVVSAPLGPAGPRLAPGVGRTDVVAPIDGEMCAVRRDLAREREMLRGVLDRFPALEPPEDRARVPEWSIDDPEQALAIIEALPAQAGIDGIDWPQGRRMHVVSAGAEGVKVRVKRDGRWFAIDGELRVDEDRVLDLAQLLEWAGSRRSRFVPLGEDRWLALTDRLRQQIDDLAAVAEPGRGAALRAPEQAAEWLDDALADTRRDDEALRDRLAALRSAVESPVALPAALQATLRPYQAQGYAWIAQRAQAGFGACLADDMGLGKTVQALALLLARASLGPALVVAPTSVCANWIDEAGRFAPGLRARLYGAPGGREELLREAGPGDLVVVSYTLLQQSVEAFAGLRWATLVADEAQAIKNASAKRSQAVRELDADFRLALSGTPIENRLDELWAIMNFTNPGLLGSAQRFGERFVVPIERDRDLRAQRTLRRLIAPFVLRRLKSEVLDDLPARTETVLHVSPEPDEAAHYELLRRQALATALGAGSRDRINVLAQLTRLRRAACDPRLVSPELGIVGAKVGAFVELAQELVANRHKALVFSQFTDFLALLREPVAAAGIASQYLDGSTPAAERARRIAAFQAGEGDLFFISLKAGGFGLNLTAADYVVIVDPWWNPAAEDQASGRAHRIGQSRPVTVYRLVTRGSIEERIVALHHDKRSLAQGILEDIDATALPSMQELVSLLDDDPLTGP
jgi:superfamily II DNA or RNA helicase